MIARLVGTLEDHNGGTCIIDVSGVGYEVFGPVGTIEGWATAGGEVTAHIATQVREDAFMLYGFSSKLDRTAFRSLLAVSGVGPKTALAAIDSLGVQELARAIEHDDTTALCKISGIGKKTAQRMALDLKGKMPVEFMPTNAQGTTVRLPRKPSDPLPLALAQLDYGKSEIDRALAGLQAQGLTVDAPLADRIRASLTLLSGKK